MPDETEAPAAPKTTKTSKASAAASSEPEIQLPDGVTERPDGFYEVAGVEGYHKLQDAIRVARQVAIARRAEEAEKAGKR